MDEVKILSRGGAYLTPMQHHHIDEFCKVISKENIYEIALLGYEDIKEALNEMYECSESYIVRDKDLNLVCVGGLWHVADQEFPQMFAMFSKDMSKNFKMLARGSRMLVNFFDQTQEFMTMTILSDYEKMLDWAAWLGFEPVAVVDSCGNKYVEFVRCNPKRSNVYNQASRPAKH